VSYLAAGACVWWPVVHGKRSAGAKAAYLFAAFVLSSPLGLLLALIPRAIYPFYAQAPRTWGPSPLADQQIAGVTMAAEEAIVFFGAFAAYLLRFLADEQASGAFSSSSNASAPGAGARPAALGAAPGSARPRR
jgi:putative membrane protein